MPVFFVESLDKGLVQNKVCPMTNEEHTNPKPGDTRERPYVKNLKYMTTETYHEIYYVTTYTGFRQTDGPARRRAVTLSDRNVDDIQKMIETGFCDFAQNEPQRVARIIKIGKWIQTDVTKHACKVEELPAVVIFEQPFQEALKPMSEYTPEEIREKSMRKSAHSECSHDATKSARAKCRAERKSK